MARAVYLKEAGYRKPCPEAFQSEAQEGSVAAVSGSGRLCKKLLKKMSVLEEVAQSSKSTPAAAVARKCPFAVSGAESSRLVGAVGPGVSPAASGRSVGGAEWRASEGVSVGRPWYAPIRGLVSLPDGCWLASTLREDHSSRRGLWP